MVSVVKKICNGDQVVDEVKSFDPDIILLDVTIAGYDGRNICKQLKATNSSFKNIPIILFSAMHNLELTCLACEATDFLAKPFGVIQLIEKIKKHTEALAV